MSKSIPGPKAKAILKRGVSLFQNGLIFDDKLQQAAKRGFRPAGQVMVDKALGDHIWDVDGNKYIDFQNGWATNPIGNAHPEIIEAVHEAQKRYGFHYDHPLRYELAEKITEITPNKALSRFTYEVSGTEAAESAFYMAMCYKKRRHVITFSSSFHGNNIGTKVFGGLNTRKYLEGWNGGAIVAPYLEVQWCVCLVAFALNDAFALDEQLHGIAVQNHSHRLCQLCGPHAPTSLHRRRERNKGVLKCLFQQTQKGCSEIKPLQHQIIQSVAINTSL